MELDNDFSKFFSPAPDTPLEVQVNCVDQEHLNGEKQKLLALFNSDEFEKMNLGQVVDITNFRAGQRGAFNCAIHLLVNGIKVTISLVLPTRYGKSDVIRALALELYERGQISGAIIAAPATHLRDQLMNFLLPGVNFGSLHSKPESRFLSISHSSFNSGLVWDIGG